MTVIVANDTPDAIRGILKRWFIEPRPNVFVGTLNRRTRDKTLEYVKRNAEGLDRDGRGGVVHVRRARSGAKRRQPGWVFIGLADVERETQAVGAGLGADDNTFN
jgi:CRISPR-associated endoribonuclease Cas2 subtype I-E